MEAIYEKHTPHFFCLGISISFLNLAFASHVGDFVECQEAGGENEIHWKSSVRVKK